MKKYKIPETTDGWIKFWVINVKPYYDKVKKIYDEYVKVIIPKHVSWTSDGTDYNYIYGTEPYVKKQKSTIQEKLTELSLVLDGLKYEYDIDEKDMKVVYKLIDEIEGMANENGEKET